MRTQPLLTIALLAGPALVISAAAPQAATTAGTIEGAVSDPTGATVPGASVAIANPVTRFQRTATTDQNGAFRFANVPFNPYHIEVSAPGFQTAQQDITVRSAVPVTATITLALEAAKSEVTVHSGSTDLLEPTPTEHTDIDRVLLSRLPVGATGTGLSDAITLGTPGIVADSNGMFHPLGEHADTTIALDNQPITDQQSKTFSNQLALNTIQSMEVIAGVPPAEYGDKAGLVVNATSRSGLGLANATGSVTAQYGSFGTWGGSAVLGIGGPKWGNFIALTSAGSGRFLDAPEFAPLHAHGNGERAFDRFDFQPTTEDTLHLNLSLSRSWFQVPNTWDQQFAGQDQRQWLRSANVAPGWTHLFSTTTLLTLTPFFRQDLVRYFPSRNVFSDRPATVGQQRRLTNFGLRAGLSYVRGIHNLKLGAQYVGYLLSENFSLAITDPAFNALCSSAGAPVTGTAPNDPRLCGAAGYEPNPAFQPGLLPYDLTRGGTLFRFRGSATIKQEGFYAQDQMTLGRLTLMAGLRLDNYDGLSDGTSLQPRLGASYLLRRTATVLRVSYGRIFETPYNENLVLSSSTGAGGLATNVFGAFGATPLRPGIRTQYDAGVEQVLGRYLRFDGDYFWKFTGRAFDFDTLFNTPITFPIEWRKSKVDGLALRVNLVNVRGVVAYTDVGHTRARFFGPEVGGLIFNSPLSEGAFRVDHDQAFEQTTYAQYQFGKRGPWVAVTWRYDSGMVAGSVPDLTAALSLTGDQQYQMGLHCGGVFAAPWAPIRSCAAGSLTATRVRVPALGTGNDDTNPSRIAPRHLFDFGGGIDDLFHTDRPRLALRLTALNLLNKAALYNFLSTFSGTHFVTPRAYQTELTLNF